MERNRFVIELGTGVDLHGEDATEASCRAVTDAISNSCLCGLSEVVKPEEATKIEVEILIATPKPDSVDVDRVKSMAPIGEKSVQVIEGGMTAQARVEWQLRHGLRCRRVSRCRCCSGDHRR